MMSAASLSFWWFPRPILDLGGFFFLGVTINSCVSRTSCMIWHLFGAVLNWSCSTSSALQLSVGLDVAGQTALRKATDYRASSWHTIMVSGGWLWPQYFESLRLGTWPCQVIPRMLWWQKCSKDLLYPGIWWYCTDHLVDTDLWFLVLPKANQYLLNSILDIVDMLYVVPVTIKWITSAVEANYFQASGCDLIRICSTNITGFID